MNHIYRTIWNDITATFVAVPENARGAGKTASASTGQAGTVARFILKALSVSVMLVFGANAYALPVGGTVAAGSATVNSSGNTTTVNQASQNTVINWQSFNIGQGQTVQFVQPNASSVALNRVTGSNPSAILGNLSANGKVFLVNPNGILFGQGATVNVGGLVASTLNISDSNLMAGNYTFDGNGTGTVTNQGSINANGGYVALLGANVSNQGLISATLGTVILAAGNGITLDVAGDGLLNVQVNQGTVNALVENGGLIRANGGQVVLTASAAGSLLQTVVNNTGVIEAQTFQNHNGTIRLLGDMQSGTVNAGGTLDASAPNGGNGGFIETSAAHVYIADDAHITTAAPMGLNGNFLIDPQDFIIGGNASDNISGATLAALLVTNSVTITTSTGPDTTVAGTPPLSTRNTAKPGNGDIFVNQAVAWTAVSSPTTLRLNADRDVNINSAISATNGNVVACCGRDVNMNAAVTTVNGSVLLSGGRNTNINAALTTTDGNIQLCAAQDVNINAAITLTRGSSIPAQSLGLPRGLTINADTDGSGPGRAGGAVVFGPGILATVNGPNAPVVINYNPVSYSSPTDYSGNFTLTLGSTLTQHMLVFPEANKVFDGSTSTTFVSLKGNPPGVFLIANPGSTATFDTIDVGTGKSVSFSGYTLGGPNASQYAFASTCCGTITGKTTGNITPSVVTSNSSNFSNLLPPPIFGTSDTGLTVVPAETPNVVAVAEELPAEILPQPVDTPPKRYIAPKRARKQDRS